MPLTYTFKTVWWGDVNRVYEIWIQKPLVGWNSFISPLQKGFASTIRGSS